MHVVLVNPLIPQNTGSISRLCAGTNSDLHLVGQLGFSLDDKLLKRAGLDYWPGVRLHIHRDFDALLAQYPRHVRCALLEPRDASLLRVRRDRRRLAHLRPRQRPAPELRTRFGGDLYKIPISGHVRSLNLATSVGIALYDGLRQLGFPTLA